MTREQKETAWARKMQLARELAGFHQTRMRVSGVRWQLADGAVVWHYPLQRTGQRLWSEHGKVAHE